MVTRVAIPSPSARHTPVSLPGHRAPDAGFEQPFDMLSACHERVERMLALLQRLTVHLEATGWDASAAQAAADVARYFDQAAPLHHEDEERHVFPLLLASPDDSGLHAVVCRLQQDHRDMQTLWALARPVLQRIHQPGDTPWQALTPNEQLALTRFSGLYAAHLEAEDHRVYPAARALLTAAQQQAMATDMMARRGVV